MLRELNAQVSADGSDPEQPLLSNLGADLDGPEMAGC